MKVSSEKYFSGQLILRLLQKGLLKIKKKNEGESTKVNLTASSSVLDEIEEEWWYFL